MVTVFWKADRREGKEVHSEKWAEVDKTLIALLRDCAREMGILGKLRYLNVSLPSWALSCSARLTLTRGCISHQQKWIPFFTITQVGDCRGSAVPAKASFSLASPNHKVTSKDSEVSKGSKGRHLQGLPAASFVPQVSAGSPRHRSVVYYFSLNWSFLARRKEGCSLDSGSLGTSHVLLWSLLLVIQGPLGMQFPAPSRILARTLLLLRAAVGSPSA